MILKHFLFYPFYARDGEPGSSVSIVPGYGLDDREIEVRYQAEAKEFFI
jgi:hypothetical protein